jgi:AraC-like DNA-binding protein
MMFQEFTPSARLSTLVKSFFYFESDVRPMSDVVFPGGNMEVVFNLGSGVWKTASRGRFVQTPKIEIWGQLTQPLQVRSEGLNKMLGARFFAAGAAAFFRENLSELNDDVSDARAVFGKEIDRVHEQLLNLSSMTQRVALLEKFLLDQIISVDDKASASGAARVTLVRKIARELQHGVFAGDIKALASRHDVSPRYLQQLFLQHTGVTPKLFHKISRFQASLKLVTRQEKSLTTIAYDCGYADQSHFIREFKSFTGLTPSSYSPDLFPVSAALVCD